MNRNSKLYKELTHLEISEVLKNYFKENIEFESNIIQGGLFNTTYYIKVDKVNKELILRVGPVNKDLLLPFEENLMKSEEYTYRLLKENNIPCSNILICDTSNKIINRDYMIIEYINSKTLSSIELSKEAENKLYEDLGVYISKLHSIKSNKFGRIYDISIQNGFDTWYEYIINEYHNIELKLNKYKVYTKNELDLVKLSIHKSKNILNEIKDASLVHGDLWSGNVLIKQAKGNYEICAIIDADRSFFGDSEFEFASNWITNKYFRKGYNKTLISNPRVEHRRKIYTLLYLLIDAYVWTIQYDNPRLGLENKTNSLELVKEILLSKF